MPTIHVQLSVTFDENSARAVAELLAPALRQALTPRRSEEEERRDARLRASRNAIYAGQKPPVDESLLVDSREAAKLLGISDRTLWKMRQERTIVPPIKIGSAVRWHIGHLRKWLDEGCPSPKT